MQRGEEGRVSSEGYDLVARLFSLAPEGAAAETRGTRHQIILLLYQNLNVWSPGRIACYSTSP